MHGYISTPGLKSDVSIVFHDPDVIEDAKISAICLHLKADIELLIFAWIFGTSA